MSMNAHHCCIVFSHDMSVAKQKLDEIYQEKGCPDNIKRIISPSRISYRYEDEEWIWVKPNETCRGYRAHKAYIDRNCTIKDLHMFIIPIFELYCEKCDFHYFN